MIWYESRATEDIKFLFRKKFAAEATRNVPKFPYEMYEKPSRTRFSNWIQFSRTKLAFEIYSHLNAPENASAWIFQKTKMLWPASNESCNTALPRTICSKEGGHKRFPSEIKPSPIRTYLSLFSEWFISRAYFFILLEALFCNIEGFSLIELWPKTRFCHRPSNKRGKTLRQMLSPKYGWVTSVEMWPVNFSERRPFQTLRCVKSPKALPATAVSPRFHLWLILFREDKNRFRSPLNTYVIQA